MTISYTQRARADDSVALQAIVRVPGAETVAFTFDDGLEAKRWARKTEGDMKAQVKEAQRLSKAADRKMAATKALYATEQLSSAVEKYRDAKDGASARQMKSINAVLKPVGAVKCGDLDKVWAMDYVERMGQTMTYRGKPYSQETIHVHFQIMACACRWLAAHLKDPKQLQPIGAGGIFGSLMREHGRAEISHIQRQRTDFAPLLDWLDARSARSDGGLTGEQARALRLVPEDGRMAAMEAVCSKDPKLSRAFAKWRARFDHEWMREVVEQFAKGDALPALEALDARGRLKLISGLDNAMAALISAWNADKTPLPSKAMVAGTRAEVSELNRLARARLAEAGAVRDALGVEIEIIHRDEAREAKRFAPGDRVVFTMNDRALGVVNGAAGTARSIESAGFEPRLVVELDDANERGERLVSVPASFGRFDLAYCLTNHKAQGRTFDSAYVLANPAMADREWTYVAASRSRFATTVFVNTAALGLVDPESHRADATRERGRPEAIEALAKRVRRSRAKGTSLDYGKPVPQAAIPKRSAVASFLARIMGRNRRQELAR